jgi:polyisoprenoid-binding protein YceI
MKKLIILALVFSSIVSINAQGKYFTKDAAISFDATAKSSPETISGKSSTGSCVLDAATGNLEFALLIKSLNFEKALMQEHFNENYMESSKFPKATFKGKIENLKDINFGKDGNYTANIVGELNVHGVTQTVKTAAKFRIAGDKINATSSFSVNLVDYKIDIPSLVKDKVAKTATIDVNANFQALKK